MTANDCLDQHYESTPVLPFVLEDSDLEEVHKNNLCCQCSGSNEVPLIEKLKICDLLLQILHRLLVWLNCFLVIVTAALLLFYNYQGILSAKDWILSIFESLYEYFLSFFSLLQTVYDFVVTTPNQIAEFFEDVIDDLIGGASDLWSF
jgi:hypothetical protein